MEEAQLLADQMVKLSAVAVVADLMVLVEIQYALTVLALA
jgi:hypothetical protein